MDPFDPHEPVPNSQEPPADPFETSSDPIDVHEQRIRELSAMHRNKAPDSFEQELDRADSAYATAHNAGLIRDQDGTEEEDFVWPSVQREQLYQERLRQTPQPHVIYTMTQQSGVMNQYSPDRMTEMRRQKDPRVGLQGQSCPVAILEQISDNDPLDGSYTMTWLAFPSSNAANAYGETVGWDHEKPGPGEDDGVYTVRKLFDNPYFLEAQNRLKTEADPARVEQELFKFMREFNLDPSTQQAEMTLVQNLLFMTVEAGNYVAAEMLSPESDDKQVSGYLMTEMRNKKFKHANYAMQNEFKKIEDALHDVAHLGSHRGFSDDDIEFIRKTAVKLTDELQVRYEQVESTRDTFQLILTETLRVAQLRLQGRSSFLREDAAAGERRWDNEVDRIIRDSEEVIAAGYRRPLEYYIKGSFGLI